MAAKTKAIYQVTVDGKPEMFGAFDKFADLDLAMARAAELFADGRCGSITIDCDPSRDATPEPADLLAGE